jgi:hypothetical protein
MHKNSDYGWKLTIPNWMREIIDSIETKYRYNKYVNNQEDTIYRLANMLNGQVDVNDELKRKILKMEMKQQREYYLDYHVEELPDRMVELTGTHFFIQDRFDSPVWAMGLYETQEGALTALHDYIHRKQAESKKMESMKIDKINIQSGLICTYCRNTYNYHLDESGKYRCGICFNLMKERQE